MHLPHEERCALSTLSDASSITLHKYVPDLSVSTELPQWLPLLHPVQKEAQIDDDMLHVFGVWYG